VASVLAAVERAGSGEVIVVDNGSAAAFRAGLEQLPRGVRVLDEAARGAAAARNRGGAAAEGDAVFFTDADCVVEKGWIAEGLAGLAATGAGVLRGAAGGITPNRASRIIAAQFAGRRGIVAGAPTRCDGRNMAVRREVLERVQFPADLLRGEDIVFGMLAEAAGFRVAAWPGMRVAHEHEASLAVFAAKRVLSGWCLREASARWPGLRWPYRRGARMEALAGRAAQLPRGRTAAWGAARVAIAAAAGVERAGGVLPMRAAGVALRAAAVAAFGAGGMLRDAGVRQAEAAELVRVAGRRAVH
jgi:glycosyltransferase involved in cell wall biosynthesis